MAPMFLLASHNAQEGLPEKMIRQSSIPSITPSVTATSQCKLGDEPRFFGGWSVAVALYALALLVAALRGSLENSGIRAILCLSIQPTNCGTP
jgi:hypothetical protein